MQLEQAIAVLKYHQKETWPTRSRVQSNKRSASLTIDVGSEATSVRVRVHVSESQPRPEVEVITYVYGVYQLLHGIQEVDVLARLGGSLIQVSNLVSQIIALEVSDGADGC